MVALVWFYLFLQIHSMTGDTQKIHLLVADDHDVVREGMKRILESYPEIQIAAEARNGNEVLSLVDHHEIDILLLDISMPGPGILDLLQKLQKKHPGIRILVLSVHSEDQYAMRVLKAGAKGYLEKSHSKEELHKAIKTINNGHTYVTPSLAEKVLNRSEHASGKLPHEFLSNRELQILLLIGEGKTNAGIASTLSLSPKTVSTYRSRILEKTGLKNNNELIRYAIENELIQ